VLPYYSKFFSRRKPLQSSLENCNNETYNTN